MLNARFNSLAGLPTETLCPSMYINWNPVDNTGGIQFSCQDFITVDGVAVAPTMRFDMFNVPLGIALTRVFTADEVLDPITGTNLSQVSGAGLMVLIKVAFDQLFNEYAAAKTADFAESPTSSP